MALDLVTGYKGTAHITAEDVGAFNAGIFGSGEYVLNSGNKLSASLTSNNTVKILDGDLMMQGRHITLKKDTFEEVTIENGENGMNRIDLIVARYTKDSNTGVENVEFAVVKGTPTSGTATAPECTTGDILSGDCTLHEMPLYKVSLSGLTAGAPEAIFEMSEHSLGEMNGILYRGELSHTFSKATDSTENIPEFWENIGNGIFSVEHGNYVGGNFLGSSQKGTLMNLITERDVSQLFFANGMLMFRGSSNGKWAQDWSSIHTEIPYVMGTYTGDGKGLKFIELGFTPWAVLVTRSDGSMVRSHWGGGFGSYFYGGFAIKNSNCLFWDGTTDIGVVTIENNGFYVYNTIVGEEGTAASSKGYIMTNSESKFHYIAFRRFV